MTVLVFKQAPRPSTADANCVAVLKHLVTQCNPNNLCVVFTFCDGINPNKRLKNGERRFDREYACGWFNENVRKDDEGNVIEGIPELPQERFFLFNGEEGYTPETSTMEINEFIRSCMPQQQEQATSIQQFNYAAYLETAKNGCNKDL